MEISNVFQMGRNQHNNNYSNRGTRTAANWEKERVRVAEST